MKKENIKKIGVCLLGLGLVGIGATVAFSTKSKMKKPSDLYGLAVPKSGDHPYMGNVIKEIQVYCNDASKAGDVLSDLHDQLKGNQDYIECNIILNDDVVIENGEVIGSVITCTVYNESQTNPLLTVSKF